jgi:hypothetical protein
MPSVAVAPIVFVIPCIGCQQSFKYTATRSNNYSKICPACRKFRTAANKKRHEERRSSSSSSKPTKEVYRTLDDIPDYVIHPVKFIDAYIKACN